jgi:hypothetical protein
MRLIAGRLEPAPVVHHLRAGYRKDRTFLRISAALARK